MTERLYYTDPALLEFDTEIVETGRAGDRHYTILRQSAFYPTSGGQQFDTGTLNETPVVDVVEDESHEVRHITEQPVGAVGDHVRGIVDRQRRRRHRRQHTAQHILSQSLIRCLGAETVSVHLGEEYGAVELNREEVSDSDLAEVESFANQVVADSLPVKIMFVEGEEIDKLPLRKIPDRSGPLRVIRVGEFDYSACGGTHCVNTSEVIGIKLVGTEKIRGHLLVKFLSGEQVWEDYDARFRVTNLLSQELTCHIEDFPAKFEKLSEENKQLRKDLAELQKELLPIKATQLAENVRRIGEHGLVAEDIGAYDKKGIGQLAGAVAEKANGVAMLYSDGRVVIATSESSGLDAGAMAREITTRLGLKGGGNARQSQLGGATSEQLSECAEIVGRMMGNG
ncbi:MAG TPA: DHHA1 domain-containing protein [candidate division Zixibacteria bacterium]|nr:DHHA1 domain-containing protein [candidate division Zixibacteria bacterium]